MRSDTDTRGPGGGDFGEGDLEALFHAAPVPDMGVDTGAVVAGARRTRTRRRVAAVSGVTAVALVVGGAWLSLPGSRDRASTDPAAPTSERLVVPPSTGLVDDLPGVTYDVRLEPAAGTSDSGRVVVSDGARRVEIDVRREDLAGTAGITRRLGPRDFVVVTDSAVQGVDIELTASSTSTGGRSSADTVIGRTGLKVFAVRFEQPVSSGDVEGTLAVDGSRVWSSTPGGHPGRVSSAKIPGQEAVLYVDPALDLMGAVGGGNGASVHLSDVDDRVALLWSGEGTTGAAGLFPTGADVTSASVTWDAPGASPGRRTAAVVTLEPSGRAAWYATIASPGARYDFTTASLTWTDQDGTHTAKP
ncbi:hypothetical protein AWH69_14465 [Janibacter melonis]|uniref:Uncharacterized protein n=1 Tax=Janibacter melonis TaxID=262209 RepID=A0A176QA15_9MICO|nr:hypothetical protein [Janibacter melonis]OAB86524.1 hypothetical protein AWH69_14465 [Janibacter melonis]